MPIVTVEHLETKAMEGLRKYIAGYTLSETKITYDIDEDGSKRMKSEVVTKKRVPPDLSAVMFTLTNLNPARWKAKPDGSVPPSDQSTELDLSKLSETALEELSRLI